MKIAAWTKPNTTETRIYFNGVYAAESEDVKVFAVARTDSKGFEIKFSGRMFPSKQDEIMNSIDFELMEMNGGERVTEFAELLKLAGA